MNIIRLLPILYLLLPAAAQGQMADNPRLFLPVPTHCISPRTRPNVCSFYRECLHVALPCTAPGRDKYEYALSYGEKYCNEFSAARERLSEAGRRWVEGTRLCLQEAVDMDDGRNLLSGNSVIGRPIPKLACQTLRILEFNVHPSCYLGGPAHFSKTLHSSICDLPFPDQAFLLTRVDLLDVISVESLTQISKVADVCLQSLSDRFRRRISGDAVGHSFAADLADTDPDTAKLIGLWTWKKESWINRSRRLPPPNPPAVIADDFALPQGIQPIPQGLASIRAALVGWDYYLRHRNFVAEISRRTTDLDQQDSTFNVVPGLSDSGGVSFESKNFPGYFLRHNNLVLKLQQKDGSRLFDDDATFYPRPASKVPAAGAVSFESFNYPGYYIRHKNFKVYLEAFQFDEQFRQDAAFFVNGL